MQSFATYTALVLMLLSDAQEVTAAPGQANCGKLMQAAGTTAQFDQNVAHAIHSMSLETLRKFEPSVSDNNLVTNLNKLVPSSSTHNIQFSNLSKSSPLAFATDGMRLLNSLFDKMDTKTDIELTLIQVLHAFHMEEMGAQIFPVYQRLQSKRQVFNNPWLVCQCATDVDNNGITKALREYPELSSAYYRSPTAASGKTVWNNFMKNLSPVSSYAYDAGLFLYCALKDA